MRWEEKRLRVELIKKSAIQFRFLWRGQPQQAVSLPSHSSTKRKHLPEHYFVTVVTFLRFITF